MELGAETALVYFQANGFPESDWASNSAFANSEDILRVLHERWSPR